MKMEMLISLIAAQSLAALPPAGVRVKVEGVRDDLGVVTVELCTAATFLGTSCSMSNSVRAQTGTVTVDFAEVPAGTFAIQAFHDRNSNGRVDRSVLGIPTEEVGFSRSAPTGLTGPKFERAAFTHETEGQEVTVVLKRYF